MNLSPAVIDELSLDAHALGVDQGVVVADVASNSPAAQFGLQKGDVILGVNGATIRETPRSRRGDRSAEPRLGPQHRSRRPDDPLAHRFLSAVAQLRNSAKYKT